MTSTISKSRTIICGVVCVAIGGFAGVGWATHDEPGRGKAIRGSMVTSYLPCTNPNTVTEGGLPQPACSPPVRSDPVCGFGALDGATGMAKAKGVVHDGDIDLSVSVSGLGL